MEEPDKWQGPGSECDRRLDQRAPGLVASPGGWVADVPDLGERRLDDDTLEDGGGGGDVGRHVDGGGGCGVFFVVDVCLFLSGMFW